MRSLTLSRWYALSSTDTGFPNLRQRDQVADRPDGVQERRLRLAVGGEDGDEHRERKCGLQRVLR